MHYGKMKPQFCDSRDGNKYVYVTIGTQTWMAENLNYNAGGSKFYDNDTTNCTTYGRLYNWATAMENCPKGWHLPSNAELEKLTSFIESTKSCTKCAANHLKAQIGWNNNGNGDDSYGFSALPGCYGYADSFNGILGNDGLWWSASESSSSNAHYWNMTYSSKFVSLSSYLKEPGLLSVRCLQDPSP